MILIMKIITIIIATLFLINSINRIKEGMVNSVYIAYLGFYFFFVLPILLDILLGYPDFSNLPFIGFEDSIDDFYSELIYCIFIIYSSCFLNFFGKHKKIHKSELISKKIKLIKRKFLVYILSIFVCIPLILSIIRFKSLGLSLENVLNYNFLASIFRNDINALIYNYLALFSILSFIMLSMLSNKSILFLSFIYSIPIYVSFGMHGKRNLVAIFLFLYFLMLIFKFEIKSKNYKYLFIILLICILIFSTVYQKNIRGIYIQESKERA